jgi:hypothetical protein
LTRASFGVIRGHLIGSHQPKEVKRQFDMLCIELDKTKENLHAEALNNLFAKYGKPEICPIRVRPPQGGRAGAGTLVGLFEWPIGMLKPSALASSPTTRARSEA